MAKLIGIFRILKKKLYCLCLALFKTMEDVVVIILTLFGVSGVSGLACLALYCTFCRKKFKPSEFSQTDEISNHPVNEVLYVGCEPESEIHDKKISSIVNYARDSMGLTEPGKNAEDSYQKYCNNLQRDLKSYEPHEISIDIKEIEEGIIIRQMNNLLAQNGIKLERIVEKAAKNVVANFYDVPRPSLYSMTESIVSEFVLVKVFQSEDNLYLTPCYMAVREKRSKKGWMFTRWEYQYYMEYKEQKFTLSKYEIQKICRSLRDESDKSEAEDNTPLTQKNFSNFGSTSNDFI